MTEQKKDDNFLSDLTDGRQKGDWKSKYEQEALNQITKEMIILVAYFIIAFSVVFISGLYFKKWIPNLSCELIGLKPYLFGFLGGFLGGTVFSMKWLVHSVAKNNWNIDRQLWRIMTPLLSAAVALLIIILAEADMFNSDMGNGFSSYKAFGIGFLSGYFSDNAIGKLTEIAQVLFGSSSKK